MSLPGAVAGIVIGLAWALIGQPATLKKWGWKGVAIALYGWIFFTAALIWVGL